MNKRHHSYLLTGILILGMASSAAAQYYESYVPDGYSMAPPLQQHLYSETASVNADSSWVEEDTTTGYQT